MTVHVLDFQSRLTSVTLPGTGGTVSFKYDPFGRRIYKSSGSVTSIYAYDADNLVEETNSSGPVVARYTQTQNVDEPLAMLRSATTSYYHVDGPRLDHFIEQWCWLASANLHVRFIRETDKFVRIVNKSVPIHCPGVRSRTRPLLLPL